MYSDSSELQDTAILRATEEELAAATNKLEMAEACLAGDGALIEGLKAELAAAKKDAERLAFVESRAYVGVNPHNMTCLWVLRGIYELPGQDFRAAIDKAMEAK